jgi:hypothetical protein
MGATHSSSPQHRNCEYLRTQHPVPNCGAVRFRPSYNKHSRLQLKSTRNNNNYDRPASYAPRKSPSVLSTSWNFAKRTAISFLNTNSSLSDRSSSSISRASSSSNDSTTKRLSVCSDKNRLSQQISSSSSRNSNVSLNRPITDWNQIDKMNRNSSSLESRFYDLNNGKQVQTRNGNKAFMNSNKSQDSLTIFSNMRSIGEEFSCRNGRVYLNDQVSH